MPFLPGSGGWPTVRYFNKETGYGGKAYPKKTDKAMCDELGPKEKLSRKRAVCNERRSIDVSCSDVALCETVLERMA